MILSLCQAFANEAPSLMRKLRAAVAPDARGQLTDRAAGRTAAHTLKSCLRYVAVESDVSLAASIETDLANADDPPEPTSLSEPIESLGRLVDRYLALVATVQTRCRAAEPTGVAAGQS